MELRAMSNLPVDVHMLGRIAYTDALTWQHNAASAVASEDHPDMVAVLEHPPVYTVGARGKKNHLLVSEESLLAKGADVIETNRGGDITFHGPGQLVLYSIMNLRRRGIGAIEYIHRLETAVIHTLSSMQLAGQAVKGRPGVWIGHRKISAIGVSIQRGITMHGLALNIDPDLQWFDAIVPCGLHGLGVTSIARETGTAPDTDAITTTVLEAIAHEFNTELRSETSSQRPHHDH
ncbi:MAG TPA: hypothetical protein DGO43_02745 [Chloroflexi bacterium]|nr:hypothetical protein [Chloroflexota bacterium]